MTDIFTIVDILINNAEDTSWLFIFLALSFGAIIFLHSKGVPGDWMIACSVFWAAYGINCVLSMKPKGFMNFTNFILKRYEK